MEGHKLEQSEILNFILAGNALFTIQNSETGNRFTFKVRKADRGNIHFVSLLNGSDNENNYMYLGSIYNGIEFKRTKGSRITEDAISYKAFSYIFKCLIVKHQIPPQVEVWHEGKCGRCGRTLTVPESIENGIGPECAKKLAM